MGAFTNELKRVAAATGLFCTLVTGVGYAVYQYGERYEAQRIAAATQTIENIIAIPGGYRPPAGINTGGYFRIYQLPPGTSVATACKALNAPDGWETHEYPYVGRVNRGDLSWEPSGVPAATVRYWSRPGKQLEHVVYRGQESPECALAGR